MSGLDEDSLRRMPYSELKKLAKDYGIRKSLKANSIIATILKIEDKEDSFVTLERQIINSCKKNKEALFDESQNVISDTPRRETYTVDDPLSDIETINASIVATSASPEFKKSNTIDTLSVKVTSESAKKNRKSKRKVSFVTPLRRSARIFTTTPQYNSLKDRPKTPIPNRSSSSKRRSSRGSKNDVAGSLNLDSSVDGAKTSVDGKVKRPSTPMPISKQKRKRLSSLSHSDDNLSPNLKSVSELVPVLQELNEEISDETPTTSFYATPNALSDGKQEKENYATVNKSGKSFTPLSNSSIKSKSAQKAIATPKQKATPKKITRMSKSPALKRTTPFSTKKTMTPGFKPIKTPMSKSKKVTTPRFRPGKTPLSKSKKAITTPGFKPGKTPMSAAKNAITTPGFKPLKTPLSASMTRSAVKFALSSSSAQKISTPIPGLKLNTTPGLSLKEISTPNFIKIHQTAFKKMESIDDYQKRKALNSAKKLKEQRKFHAPAVTNDKKKMAAEKMKKAPNVFAGIPFIPAVSKNQTKKRNIPKSSNLKKTTKPASLNASSLSQKLNKAGNAKAIKSVAKENTPLKQRPKFDLRASLAKKLTYKPHTGPIKPLNESSHNANISAAALPPAKAFQVVNPVVNNSRMETRDVLRGVRKNKRFLLQMSNRNQSMQK